jgi:purine-nucleoside phosphorylase
MPLSAVRYRLDEAARVVRAKVQRSPRIGIVLGSGLGPYADTLGDAVALPYAEIPHLPHVSIPGHSGRLVVGTVASRDGSAPRVVAALAGRVHLYEGYSPDEVVFGVRLLITLGAEVIVLTNAAGGIATTLVPGDLVAITDHLNLQGRNPLTGPNDDELGPRFPDMSFVYDPDLRAAAHAAAQRTGVQLRSGVYAALGGPSYETPAEIRMLRTMGADLIGMSTVPEAIASQHMGARVLGISCVTNLAAGVTSKPLSHAEVEETAREARERFTRLVDETLATLPLSGNPRR